MRCAVFVPFCWTWSFVGLRVLFEIMIRAVRVSERVGAESRVWFDMQYAS